MKTKPIIFSAEMIRALLDGRKTQTRRIVKPRIAEDIEFFSGGPEGEPGESQYLGLKWGRFLDDDRKEKGPEQWLAYCSEYPEEGCIPLGTAYGKSGDLLWVRETFSFYDADNTRPQYRADVPNWKPGGWRPSIHMPHKASRLTLRITNVRVERVQEINNEDSIKEGVEWDYEHGAGWKEYGKGAWPGVAACGNPRDSFHDLWNSIYGPDAWTRNDWVWCIEFSVIKKNIDEVLKQNVDDLIAGASNYAGMPE